MSSPTSQPAKKPARTCTKSSTCLCKSIHLTISGVDKGTVLCHCSNCQTFTGSAFAHNYRILNADIKVEKGAEVLKAYRDENTKSGGVLVRYFCSNCGTSLYGQPLAIKGMVVMMTGAASDKTAPAFELFGENKHEWVGDVIKSKAKM